MAETKDIASSVIQNQIHGGAPAGLSMLQEVDGLFVEQQWEVLETLTCGCYESQNQYKVYDKSGKVQLFEAKEKTMFCWRYCCGEHRPFTMNVLDVTGKKNQRMAVIKRGFLPCSWAVLPCCLHSVTAHYMVDASGNAISSTSSDTVVARVKTPWLGGCCTPTLNVYDRDHTYHGALTGPFCCVCDFCGSDFAFTDAQGHNAGGIKKLGAKTMKDVVVEVSTDADKFLITFPVATKPEIKLALLAALLHLDFTFFEDPRSIREGKCCDLYICGLACACCPRWAVCCCCYATKEAREEAKKERERRGAPQIETVMDR